MKDQLNFKTTLQPTQQSLSPVLLPVLTDILNPSSGVVVPELGSNNDEEESNSNVIILVLIIVLVAAAGGYAYLKST